jgi:hypothetical protein
MLNRLLVLFGTVFIIAQTKENNLLSNKLLVKLGNWSYSIYLIHWPLFAWHRFAFMDLYQDEAESSFYSKFLFRNKTFRRNYFRVCKRVVSEQQRYTEVLPNVKSIATFSNHAVLASKRLVYEFSWLLVDFIFFVCWMAN